MYGGDYDLVGWDFYGDDCVVGVDWVFEGMVVFNGYQVGDLVDVQQCGYVWYQVFVEGG